MGQVGLNTPHRDSEAKVLAGHCAQQARYPMQAAAGARKPMCMADGGLVGTVKGMFGAKTPPATPAPTPAPRSAISDYAGGMQDVMRRREAAAGMKAGGPVKGKGGPTSDTVPIMASPGEFMVKAKAVKKLGVPFMHKLNAVADGHSDKESKAEDKAEPKGAEKREMMGKGARKGMWMGGPVVTPEPTRAPLPAPGNLFTFQVPQDVKDSFNQGLAAVRGPAPVGGAAPSLVDTVGARVADSTGAAQPGTPALQPGGSATNPQTDVQRGGNVVAGGAAFNPAADSQSAYPLDRQTVNVPNGYTGPQGNPTTFDPSINKSVDAGGRVTYSNVPGDAGFGARGAVSPQNLAAGENLSQRYAQEAQGAAGKAAFDQQVADAAATNRAGGFGTGQASLDPRAALMDRLSRGKLTARGAQLMEQMAQTDASSANAAATTNLGARRLALDAQTHAQDAPLKATTAAGAQQIQAAKDAYAKAAAAGDEKAMARAEETLRVMGVGRDRNLQPPRQIVVPGGTYTDANNMIQHKPSQVFNPDTGTWSTPPDTQATAPIAEGSISTVNGKKAKYTGGKWVPQ